MPCQYWDNGWCKAPDNVEAMEYEGQCWRMEDCPQAIPMKEFIFTPAVRGLTRQDNGDDSEEHW